MTCIEWPDKVGRFLATHRLQIALSHTENGCLARVEWMGQVLLGHLLWTNKNRRSPRPGDGTEMLAQIPHTPHALATGKDCGTTEKQ